MRGRVGGQFEGRPFSVEAENSSRSMGGKAQVQVTEKRNGEYFTAMGVAGTHPSDIRGLLLSFPRAAYPHSFFSPDWCALSHGGGNNL